MRLIDARDDVLRKVWVENPAKAPGYVLSDVCNAFNQALQLVYLSAPDHFRRSSIEIQTEAGKPGYELPANVQAVLGPVRLPGRYLRHVDGRADFDRYHSLFLGEDDPPAPGPPLAYFVRQTAAARTNSQRATLLLTPPPNAVYTLTLDVALSPPAYSVADLASSGQLSVPHGYAESLFLPVARYYAMRSHFFGDEEHRKSLESDYEQALALYGIADARPKPEPKEAA